MFRPWHCTLQVTLKAATLLVRDGWRDQWATVETTFVKRCALIVRARVVLFSSFAGLMFVSSTIETPPFCMIVPTLSGSSATYQRHEPEKTVLYKIVSEHLESFLRDVGDHYDKPLPKYVEKELRDYLACGLLQYGFAKAVCKACGRTIWVAFSCKKRGACCSCSARRMCNGAAHLVDHVVPNVPVRQWVLSVPFELRLLLACRVDAFGAVTSLFINEVFRWQRERAREDGLAKIRYGALVMQHRFGSSLNLNTHLHAVFPDGVFSRSPCGEVEFNELRQPEPGDLEDIAFNVHQRFLRWLRRHGLLKNEVDNEFSNEAPEVSALEACAQRSLGLGNLMKKRGKPRSGNQDPEYHPRIIRYYAISEYSGLSGMSVPYGTLAESARTVV